MLLKKGCVGPEVDLLQNKLRDLSYLVDKEREGFGPLTQAAVLMFQKNHKLDMDGVVGNNTYKALDMEIKFGLLAGPPVGRTEILKIFGDPLVDGWRQMYLVKIPVPKLLHHVKGWENGYFWGNRFVADDFQKVMNEVAGKPELAKSLISFDGCFNIRYKRGIDGDLSTHSWAISWDLNAATNALGQTPTMHKGVVDCHKKFGFTWGGDFKRPDGMHFQFCSGY